MIVAAFTVDSMLATERCTSLEERTARRKLA